MYAHTTMYQVYGALMSTRFHPQWKIIPLTNDVTINTHSVIRTRNSLHTQRNTGYHLIIENYNHCARLVAQ